MKNHLVFVIITLILISCKLQFDVARNIDNDPAKRYQLHLNPRPGLNYYYIITNETSIELEVDEKAIEYRNRTTIDVNYNFKKDTAGNFALSIKYLKAHIYTKQDETETNADAQNALVTSNPLERVLGLLVQANINAVISPSGQVKSVKGYKELGDKIIEGMDPNDSYSIGIAKKQLEKTIDNGVINKNLDQFFKIFPDSAIRLGNTWKMTSVDESEVKLNIKQTFSFNEINNNVATIISESTVKSDTSNTSFMGYNSVVPNLRGKQKGQFNVDINTGMLVNCNLYLSISGTVEMLGREIPLKIINKIKIESLEK